MNRKLSELKGWDKNPRELQKPELLKKYLKKYGLLSPLKVTPDGVVLGGNARLQVLREMGETEAWVKEVNPKNDDEMWEIAMLDNQDFSKWLINDLTESVSKLTIELGDFNIPIKTQSLRDLLLDDEVEEDEAPPVPEKAESKLGEVYELGRHRLMCGDATKIEDVEKLMDGKKADMVFTDPPYGVEYVSRVDKDRRKPWGNIQNDDLKDETLREFLYDSLIMFKNVPMYVCCNWQSYPDFYLSLGRPNNVIVWDKETIGLGAGRHRFRPIRWLRLNTNSL